MFLSPGQAVRTISAPFQAPTRALALALVLIFANTHDTLARAISSRALAEDSSLTFFSALTEQPFACLAASALHPATRRHGPFEIPAPGLASQDPSLALADFRCTPDDWAGLLAALATVRPAPGSPALRLTLPDGRVFLFPRSPRVLATRLDGDARPLVSDARSPGLLSLSLSHDGLGSLVLDTRPLADTPPPPALSDNQP